MNLEDLGYNEHLESYRNEHNLDVFDVGRVISEHKDRYQVLCEESTFECELIGNLRFNAESRYDLPAVGDWVAVSPYDEHKALIHAVYPRHSLIERKAVGKSGHIQIIATNIDFGLIVLAVNRDFNINRVERYLTICNASKVAPIIVLNKIDLIDEEKVNHFLEQLKNRVKEIPVFPISNYSKLGVSAVKGLIEKGKTYCLLGSSGVGKSTLLNTLTGKEMMETGEISEAIDRGKHITSHRELVVLENGGIIIDNPGMREVGITTGDEGLAITFDEIVQLSQTCKFNDCTHVNEKGCAILDALENGTLDEEAYENYQKMSREKMHFESSVYEKRSKEKKFSKMVKRVIKDKNKHKF